MKEYEELITGMQVRKPIALGSISYILPCLGVASACTLSLINGRSIPIVAPAILLLASMTLWLRPANGRFAMIQGVMSIYLCSVPVNEIMRYHSSMRFFTHDLRISYALIVLAPFVLGHIIGLLFVNRGQGKDRKKSNNKLVWIAAITIIGIHMILQTGILHMCYGYGYERNIAVLGWISLFYLIYKTLSRILEATSWRRMICIILLTYYGLIVTGIT